LRVESLLLLLDIVVGVATADAALRAVEGVRAQQLAAEVAAAATVERLLRLAR